MDTGFRRYDGFGTFYGFINFNNYDTVWKAGIQKRLDSGL